jgi:chromosome segregation ATPase
MQDAAVEGRCRYCGVEVEQPRSGSRQKVFCSDEHRLRYWRERRKQGLPTGEEGEERQADVRTLTWELQATLQGFERTVGALGRALAEAGDLDAARVAREQVEAEAQRRVAGAEERRARAERLRLEAEALAEAAEAEVREAHGRLQEMEARVRHAEAEARAAGEREGLLRQRLEEEMSALRQEANSDVARAREGAQVAVGAAEAEVRRVTEVLESVRSQLQVLDRQLEEERRRCAALEQRLQEAEADHRGRAAQHASQIEALQAQLREAQGGLAAEREARLRAEERAQAAGTLAEERARERDRLVEAGSRKPARRPRNRPRAGAG